MSEQHGAAWNPDLVEAVARRMHARVQEASGAKRGWDDPVENGIGVDKAYWRRVAGEAMNDVELGRQDFCAHSPAKTNEEAP